jgi:hypothetical protein
MAEPGRSSSSESGPRRGAARCALLAAALLALRAGPASAGAADVVDVEIRCNEAAVCKFLVSVRHADEGWDHYADRWEIVTPDGESLATRVLRHPHVGEQPFTRTLPDVRVPESISRVRVRAHDSVHGYGGREVVVELPR